MSARSSAPCLTRRCSMIIETCPKCGGELKHLSLTTYPPIYKKVCTSCGWSWTDDKEGQ